MIKQETRSTTLDDSSDDADWNNNFTAMLEYAKSKGWLDSEGAVQAHVVWET